MINETELKELLKKMHRNDCTYIDDFDEKLNKAIMPTELKATFGCCDSAKLEPLTKIIPKENPGNYSDYCNAMKNNPKEDEYYLLGRTGKLIPKITIHSSAKEDFKELMNWGEAYWNKHTLLVSNNNLKEENKLIETKYGKMFYGDTKEKLIELCKKEGYKPLWFGHGCINYLLDARKNYFSNRGCLFGVKD